MGTKIRTPGYSWQPIMPTHGATSRYLIEPMAESILAWVLAEAEQPDSPIAFLAAPYFRPSLDRWARAEARRMRLEDWAQAHGEFDRKNGKPKPYMETLATWDKRAAYYSTVLGLDPAALARIRKDLAEAHRLPDAVHSMSALQDRYRKNGQ